MRARVRFVYFDLDDTLLNHRAAERAALADCTRDFEHHFSSHTIEHIQETYHAHNGPLWRDYGAGRIGREELKRLRFERLLHTLNINNASSEEIGTHYLACYANHWRWLDGAERAFHAVADRVPVGILTNGFAEIQHAKLERFPVLRERTARIVISEEIGVMKPDPAIFAHATESAGVSPEQILYVGDSLHSDVEGGRGFGWQVAWFRGDRALRDDVLVFDDWQVLLKRLDLT